MSSEKTLVHVTEREVRAVKRVNDLIDHPELTSLLGDRLLKGVPFDEIKEPAKKIRNEKSKV